MKSKTKLRAELRSIRRAHANSLPDSTRALLFRIPPAPLRELIPQDAVIGVYRALPEEAPAAPYAKFFQENGHAIALPAFHSEGTAMEFRLWSDPYEESDLATGPYGIMQPGRYAEKVTPDVIFAPLVGFTANGERIGQGGGHYDRWLAANPAAMAVGMAWDVQLVDELPTEPHDIPLKAIVTPTRLYGPFG